MLCSLSRTLNSLNLDNMNKFLPFFLIGTIPVFLTSMLYIGSEEQLQDVLENHLLKFIIAKFLLSFVVALIWSVIAYFSYWLLSANDQYKISAGRFFIYSEIGYLLLLLIFALLFIYLAS